LPLAVGILAADEKISNSDHHIIQYPISPWQMAVHFHNPEKFHLPITAFSSLTSFRNSKEKCWKCFVNLWKIGL
jgi:hypothetical protein